MSLIGGLRRATVLLALILLGGCMSPGIDRYARESPTLDLRRHFDGRLLGHGLVQGRDGAVLRRFVVVVDARWDGPSGTLDESFEWADGERSRRIWAVQDLGVREGVRHYAGQAADVIGRADGVAAGNALRWQYVLNVPVGDQVYAVRFDDWMFLIDEQVMIGRAEMRKWGFRVGEVTLVFNRAGAPS